MSGTKSVGVIKQTFSEWSNDNASRLAAALAYYAIFALAPMLVIGIMIAGKVWGDTAAAQQQVVDKATSFVGREGGQMIGKMIQKAGQHGSGILATIIATGLLILAATGFFAELQAALNTIWDVRARSEGIKGVLRKRFVSFLLVLGFGVLLLASVILSAVLSGMQGIVGKGMIANLINNLVSLAVFAIIFAAVFKVLPDVKMRWKDVWVGALVTAVLFTVGKYLIGLYLGRGTTTSVFGAAGALAAILLWIYYSAQILFLGAEFTQVYARSRGALIEPSEHAEWVEREEPAAEAKQSAAAPQRARRPAPATAPALRTRTPGAVSPIPQYHPASQPAAAAENESGGSGKLVPMLIGLVVGKLLLPGGGKKKGAKRHFAPARIVEPGWVSRNRQAALAQAEIEKKDIVLRVRPPKVVNRMAEAFREEYRAERERLREA